MKVMLKSGNKIDYEYKIVIYGDVTGEGNINSRDITALFNHLLGKESLIGSYLIASDVNHDNIVDNADLLLIERYIYDNYPIYQK